MIYVLTMWNETKAAHELILTGPFTSEYKAGVWGEKWQAEQGDSPLWQVVDLPAPSFRRMPAPKS